MGKINTYPIFPTVLGTADLGRDFTNEELLFIKSLKFEFNAGNYISLNEDVLEAEEMCWIKDFCLSSINTYVKEVYKPLGDLSLRITQSWVNITKQGQYHHKHSHSNSAFSASFYINTREEDRIYFYSPIKELMKIESTEYTNLNSHTWWMPARKYSMVMFPSWLEHQVMTKNHDGDRISLSFNTFYVGEIGSKGGRTHLVLE